MTSYSDPLSEFSRMFAVEEQRGDQEEQKDLTPLYDFDDPSDRRDFIMLMISIVIMAFATWWFTP